MTQFQFSLLINIIYTKYRKSLPANSVANRGGKENKTMIKVTAVALKQEKQ